MYKITIEEVEKETESNRYGTKREIFTQTVPNLDIRKVIGAINAMVEIPESPFVNIDLLPK